MVQQLPCTPPHTPTRSGLLLAEPAQAWHVFTQRFVEHWDGCTHVYPRSQPPYSEGLVDKMRGGGNPEKRGDIAYRCLHGGEGTHLVARRWKSSLCLRGAKVYVDHWGSQVSQMRHAGVIYRPSVLTVPAMCRTPCYQNAQVLLSAFMRWGVRGVDECVTQVSGRALQGGSSVVSQPQGRNGQYHPPLPIIATSGGGEPQARQWVHLDSLP